MHRYFGMGGGNIMESDWMPAPWEQDKPTLLDSYEQYLKRKEERRLAQQKADQENQYKQAELATKIAEAQGEYSPELAQKATAPLGFEPGALKLTTKAQREAVKEQGKQEYDILKEQSKQEAILGRKVKEKELGITEPKLPYSEKVKLLKELEETKHKFRLSEIGERAKASNKAVADLSTKIGGVQEMLTQKYVKGEKMTDRELEVVKRYLKETPRKKIAKDVMKQAQTLVKGLIDAGEIEEEDTVNAIKQFSSELMGALDEYEKEDTEDEDEDEEETDLEKVEYYTEDNIQATLNDPNNTTHKTRESVIKALEGSGLKPKNK